MTDSCNVQVVKEIFSAYGSGQIPAILERLHESVIWIEPGEGGLSWAGTFRGRAEVPLFFKRLDAAVKVDRFEPQRYFEAGAEVVVLGHWAGTTRTKAKPFAGDWVMTWSFESGKVAHYQAHFDTYTVALQL